MRPFLPLVVALSLSVLPVRAEELTVAALDMVPVQVAVATDGSHFFTVQPAKAEVRVWNTATGTLDHVYSLSGAFGPIAALSNGTLAVVVRENIGPSRGTPPRAEPIDSVRLMKPDGSVSASLRLPSTDLRRTVTTLTVSADGKKLLGGVFALTRSGGERGVLPAMQGEVVTWDLTELSHPATIQTISRGAGVRRIVSTTEKTMAVLSNGSHVLVRPDEATPHDATEMMSPRIGFNGDVALSGEGKWLAVLNGNRLTVQPATTDGTGEERAITAIRNPAAILFLSETPTRLAVATTSGTIALIDPETGELRDTWTGKPYERFVAMVAGTKGRVLTVRDDGLIRVWDQAAKQIVATVPSIAREPRALAATGDALLAVDTTGILHLWDRQRNTLRWTSGTALQDINVTALISPEGNRAFVSSGGMQMLALDIQTGKPLWDSRQAAGFTAIALTSDGKTIAAVSSIPTAIRLLDSGTGTVKATFPLDAHAGPLPSALAFSPDGKTLATLVRKGRAAEIHILDASNGTQNSVISLSEYVNALQYLPDGKTIVAMTAGIGRSSALLLAPVDGSDTQRIELDPTGPGDAPRSLLSRPLQITLSSDGKTVALGAMDGAITLCDATTGKVLRRFPAPAFATSQSATGSSGTQGGTSAIAFDTDHTLIVADGDRSVRLFDSSTGVLKGTLRFLNTGDSDDAGKWLWSTPSGIWEASPSVWPYLKKVTASGDVLPAKK